MRERTSPRKPVVLSEPTQRRLGMYALAAGAAGVGMLALEQPAEAKIVYTPARIHISPPKERFTKKRFTLDLNHDGLTDFVFTNSWGPSDGRLRATFSVNYNFRKNEVLATATYGPCAVGLAKGKSIGPNKGFRKVNAALGGYTSTGSFVFCPWGDQKAHYLGLRFSIHGKTHYGWARFEEHFGKGNPPGISVLLSGYAYETIPNKPIIAGQTKGTEDSDFKQPNPTSQTVPTPEPATLGALAMGAPGLSIWRRKESSIDGQ
jgi:hypothetical protein